MLLKFNEFKTDNTFELKNNNDTIFKSDDLKDLLVNGIGNHLNFTEYELMDLEDELTLAMGENGILFEDDISKKDIVNLNIIVKTFDGDFKIQHNTNINENTDDGDYINNSNIDVDDIIEVINNNGVIYTNIVDNYPDHNEDDPLTPVSVDGGEVLVYIDGDIHHVDLKYIKSYEL